VNEVESTSRRVATTSRASAVSVWDWLSDLGQGAWVLVLGCLALVCVLVAIVIGRGDTSPCDKAVSLVQDVRLYDGSVALTSEGANALHSDATQLDHLADKATGGSRDALTALADDARQARTDQPFDAGDSLAAYRSAC
jgi:hypothetical protein